MKNLIIPGVNPNHFPEVTEISDAVATAVLPGNDVEQLDVNYSPITVTAGDNSTIVDGSAGSLFNTPDEFNAGVQQGDIVIVGTERRRVMEVESDTRFYIDAHVGNQAVVPGPLYVTKTKVLDILQGANFVKFSTDSLVSVNFDSYSTEDDEVPNINGGIGMGTTFTVGPAGATKKLSGQSFISFSSYNGFGTLSVEFFS
jgi:hypothetical protein